MKKTKLGKRIIFKNDEKSRVFYIQYFFTFGSVLDTMSRFLAGLITDLKENY